MKKTNSLKTFKEFLFFFKKYKYLFIIAHLMNAVNSFTRVADINIIRNIVDNYIVPLISNFNNEIFNNFLYFIWVIGFMYIISVIAEFSCLRIIHYISENISHNIRSRLFSKIQSLPLEYFDKNKHGEIMNLYTTDIESIKTFFTASVGVVYSFVSLSFILYFMLIYNWQLTLLVLFLFILVIYLQKNIQSKVKNKFKETQDKLGKLQGYIEEIFQGQKIIKIFNCENKINKDFENLNENYRKIATTANIYGNMFMPLSNALFSFIYIMILILSYFYFKKKLLSIGTFIIYMQFVRRLKFPLAIITLHYSYFLTAISSFERILKVLNQDNEIDNGKIIAIKYKNKDYWKIGNTIEKIKGEIEFKNVYFGYDNKNVLSNINIKIKSGQKVAIVGSTGAGKTTILNLINRFYEIKSGKILFDGIDIKNIKKHYLRKYISTVLQDTHLFTGTIIDNIKYGNQYATNKDIYKAAKISNADKFIQYLPNKYNTILNNSNGTSLSQGEKQLISITRTLISNPYILILDEATSSIDTRTEKLIENGMKKLIKGKTVFIIAHRLSTVRNSDLILVMENGNIIEYGNHKELLLKKGHYYDLYKGIIELK